MSESEPPKPSPSEPEASVTFFVEEPADSEAVTPPAGTYVPERVSPSQEVKIGQKLEEIKTSANGILSRADHAMGRIQDDGRVTGERDRQMILLDCALIDTEVRKIREALGSE